MGTFVRTRISKTGIQTLSAKEATSFSLLDNPYEDNMGYQFKQELDSAEKLETLRKN